MTFLEQGVLLGHDPLRRQLAHTTLSDLAHRLHLADAKLSDILARLGSRVLHKISSEPARMCHGGRALRKTSSESYTEQSSI